MAYTSHAIASSSSAPSADDPFQPTFFVRALYDYQSNDPSSLSFFRDEIIEVLTRLDTGWWDGILGGVRGWFPSNYVREISDQEVREMMDSVNGGDGGVFGGSAGDYVEEGVDLGAVMAQETVQAPSSASAADFWVPEITPDGQVFFVNTQTGERSADFAHEDEDADRSDSELFGSFNDSSSSLLSSGSERHPLASMAHARNGSTSTHGRSNSNTSFGSGSTAIASASGSGIPFSPNAFYSTAVASTRRPLGQSSSRSNSNDSQPAQAQAGFGIQRNESATPEPWVRRLQDNGQAYYYYNTLTGEKQWSLPDQEQENDLSYDVEVEVLTPGASGSGAYGGENAWQALTPGGASGSHSRSGSTTTGLGVPEASDRSISRISSSSSIRKLPSPSPSTSDLPTPVAKEHNNRASTSGLTSLQRSIAEAKASHSIHLSQSELAAQQLQEAMTAPPPDSIAHLYLDVQRTIQGVIECIRAEESVNAAQMGVLNDHVERIVVAVRNLLYVASLSFGGGALEKDKEGGEEDGEIKEMMKHFKPMRRKVTATLSKLVLWTRTYVSDMETSPADTASRMESEASQLNQTLLTFVQDIQAYTQSPRMAGKRLFGAFSPDHIGLGLYGGGAGGGWKGFGFAAAVEEEDVPVRVLDEESVVKMRAEVDGMVIKLAMFSSVLRQPEGVSDADGMMHTRDIIRDFTTLLRDVADLHVAKHVDIDGFSPNDSTAHTSQHDLYMKTVYEARTCVRALEASTQNIYDDSAALLSAAQGLADPIRRDRNLIEAHEAYCITLDGVLQSLHMNSEAVLVALDRLVRVGARQKEIADGKYRMSINRRMSRISTIEGNLRTSQLPPRRNANEEYDAVKEMEDALREIEEEKPVGHRPGLGMLVLEEEKDEKEESPNSVEEFEKNGTPTSAETGAESGREDAETATLNTSTEGAMDEETLASDDDELDVNPRPGRKKNLEDWIGKELPKKHKETAPIPSHLGHDYKDDEISMDPADGTVKAGSVATLVIRLTAHDGLDTKLAATFMMTWKLFMNFDTLVENLIKRFRMPPPEGLTQVQLEEWRKQKLDVVRTRVLSRIKAIVQDEDEILDEWDHQVYANLKVFLKSEDVSKVLGAQSCLLTIERAEKGENVKRTIVNKEQPPPPIIPRNINKKLKLLDIDPLEMARQLTIMEYRLFLKVRPMECILRARGKRAGKEDNIAPLIQSANLISTWVGDCILQYEDSRRRSAVIKYFINVADRCQAIRNFNTMIALLAGLNQTAIRRLARTWELVNQRTMQLLEAVEWTMDPAKNRKNYFATLAAVKPPCMPFFGVYLSQLTFIHDGNPDMVNGLVNISKHQKTADVMNDMKHWQAKPHNLQPLTGILSFIEDSLGRYADYLDSYKDHLWEMSLEREPREREDEKMARLLQESGFL